MKNIIITEQEKSRILGMHKTTTSRQYLTEQDQTVVSLTISVPYKKGANDQMVFDPNYQVKVFAPNVKGSEQTSLENYTNIKGLEMGENFVNPVTKKDANGNIVGSFSIGNEKKLATYLKSQVGKTIPLTDTSISINMGLVPSGSKIVYGGGTKFVMYDTGAKTQTTPTKP
jgi:hypothetical protein